MSMMRLSSLYCVVDVFLDDQPAAALVDLALVVVAARREEQVLMRVLAIDDTAEVLVGIRILDRRGVHAIVAARMHLPEVLAAAEQARHVEDRLERPGQDVVAQHPRTVLAQVERGSDGWR